MARLFARLWGTDRHIHGGQKHLAFVHSVNHHCREGMGRWQKDPETYPLCKITPEYSIQFFSHIFFLTKPPSHWIHGFIMLFVSSDVWSQSVEMQGFIFLFFHYLNVCGGFCSALKRFIAQIFPKKIWSKTDGPSVSHGLVRFSQLFIFKLAGGWKVMGIVIHAAPQCFINWVMKSTEDFRAMVSNYLVVIFWN